jgi:transcriptional regulator with XRE-family HTH domain
MYYPQIKLLRLKSRLKQEYVAYLLNISQPQYSKLENGFRSPNAHELSRLAELYQVTSDQLLVREGSSPVYERPARKVTDTAQERMVEALVQQNEALIKKLEENSARSEHYFQMLTSLLTKKGKHPVQN